jgi:mannose-6-phosphate isomerase class I
MDLPQLLKLTCFPVEKIWGGNFLHSAKKLPSGNKIGETWEVSASSPVSQTQNHHSGMFVT